MSACKGNWYERVGLGWRASSGQRSDRSIPNDERAQQPPCLAHSDQHLLLGAEEGIFILNRNDQEATLEMVRDGVSTGSGGGVASGHGNHRSHPFSTDLPWPHNLAVLHQQPPHVSLRLACGWGRGGGQESREGGYWWISTN